MKNLLVIFALALMVSCCVPASDNPDDLIGGSSATTAEVVPTPRMSTVTLFYQDGTNKVLEHPWNEVYINDRCVKFVYDDTYFIHYGEYDITYDR